MNDAVLQDSEMALRATLSASRTAFSNWHLSDRAAQRQALARVARIRSRRLRQRARRQLVNRLYRSPLPMRATVTSSLH
jgi:hypothetical protein